MKLHLLALAALASCIALAGACGQSSGSSAISTGTVSSLARDEASLVSKMSVRELAEVAVVGTDGERPIANARLRGMGRAGLAALEDYWAMDIACLRDEGSLHPDDAFEFRMAFSASAAQFARGHDYVSPFAKSDPRKHQSRLEESYVIVSGQHDGLYSGFYWHTDRDAALAEATSLKRPVLSLRILGRLDEAMCCANGRYMRTVLYPDPSVRKLLSESYVLHWSSERPVPLLTIDFGDGKVIRRTVTGNAAHFVFTSEGNVIDVLPGVYPPTLFHRCLTESLAFATAVTGKSELIPFKPVSEHHIRELSQRHRDQRAVIDSGTNGPSDTTTLIERTRRSAQFASLFANQSQLSPESLRLMYRDMPKDRSATASSPSLQNLTPLPSAATSENTTTTINARTYFPSANNAMNFSISKMATQSSLFSQPNWDRNSARNSVLNAIGQSNRPSLADASALAMSKSAIDMPGIGTIYGPVQRKQRGTTVTKDDVQSLGVPIWDDLLASRARSVEVNLAGDAATNELVLRPLIRTWFASGQINLRDFEALNRRVFSEVFLTPRDDPWLGMMSTDLWTGIANDGAATK